MIKLKLKWKLEKSIPMIQERESEAFILWPWNGREQEFPLNPDFLQMLANLWDDESEIKVEIVSVWQYFSVTLTD